MEIKVCDLNWDSEINGSLRFWLESWLKGNTRRPERIGLIRGRFDRENEEDGSANK